MNPGLKDSKKETVDPSQLDFRQDVDPNSLYELKSLLGEGSYGAVYSACSRAPEKTEEVAIKIIPDADDDLTSLWREIRFLQVLRSPFVVSFVESFLYDNELWLVMELCDGGSLYDLKEAAKSFAEPELKEIMAFSVLGLAHLHAQMSIHRDVKSGNILLTRDGRAKLADFGISAQLTDTIMKRRTVIGSPYWMAPEVIQETSYDGKADIWSLGITLLELCEGSPPYFNVHPMRAIFMISGKPAPTLKEPEKWSAEMKDFVGKCLVKDCEKRCSAAELLKHPWIRQSVAEIGSAGQGSPILEALIDKYWDSMERLRAARFKMPENLEENNNGNAENDGENSVATMKSNLSGMPATRQQLRNATLSRSYSSATLVRSRASSITPRRNPSDDEEGAGDSGTMITRVSPIGGAGNMKSMISYESEEKAEMASSFIRYDGTMKRTNDYGGSLIINQSEKQTSGYGDHGYGAKREANNRDSVSSMQSVALKYFRDEPMPTVPDSKKNIRRDSKCESPKLEIEEKPVTRNSRSPMPPVNSEVKSTVDAEVAILEDLTSSLSGVDDEVEELKKEIMRQLAALKKQYRQDLETFTNTYEARRKALKDALLNLSNPAKSNI